MVVAVFAEGPSTQVDNTAQTKTNEGNDLVKEERKPEIEEEVENESIEEKSDPEKFEEEEEVLPVEGMLEIRFLDVG